MSNGLIRADDDIAYMLCSNVMPREGDSGCCAELATVPDCRCKGRILGLQGPGGDEDGCRLSLYCERTVMSTLPPSKRLSSSGDHRLVRELAVVGGDEDRKAMVAERG